MRDLLRALAIVWLVLGASHIVAFSRANRPGSDLFVYLVAVQKAWRGADPYLPHNIGWGYLYPPPSLLFLRAVWAISPAVVGVRATFSMLSALAACLTVALLVRRWRPLTAVLAVFALSSAGLLETLYVGQINTFVVALLALFLWAWRRQRPVVACVALGLAISLKTTPVVFIALFLTRQSWQWLLLLAVVLFVAFLAAALAIPAPHLVTSFLDATRWASGQMVGPDFNYALTSLVDLLAKGSRHQTLLWLALRRAKLVVLGTLLLASYVPYVRRPQDGATRDALFITCNLCAVLGPNLFWLHHATLLIPAAWLLLTERPTPRVAAVTGLALMAIQVSRPGAVWAAIPVAAVVDVAQLLLLLACALHLVPLLRSPGTPAAHSLQAFA